MIGKFHGANEPNKILPFAARKLYGHRLSFDARGGLVDGAKKFLSSTLKAAFMTQLIESN